MTAFAAAALVVCGDSGRAAEPATLKLSASDYERAARFDSTTAATLVRNAKIVPSWIDDERFWYRHEAKTGHRIMLIDAAAGSRGPLFDARRMAGALGAAVDETDPALVAAPAAVVDGSDGLTVSYDVDGQSVVCDIETYRCRLDNAPASETDPALLISPNGDTAVFVRGYNLWLRRLDDRKEWALTSDGEAYASYAGAADQSRLGAASPAPDTAERPRLTHWSPAGRWLITRHLDERAVAPYPFLEAVPKDGGFRPRVHTVRVPLLGDGNLPVTTDWIIDLERGTQYPVALPEGFDLDDYATGNAPLGWRNDGRTAYLYASTADAAVGRVVELDMETGFTGTVFEERMRRGRVNAGPGGFRTGLSRVIGDQMIWYSERDGWGHLYLYDLDEGTVVRQLTHGAGPVRSLLHLDTEARVALITRARDEPGADPYQLAVYRLDIDRGESLLLTPEAAHHDVTSTAVSPDGRYFVDAYSTVDTPARTVLRQSLPGKEPLLLEQADASALFAAGWRPPDRVRVTAADGETPLYAVLFHPAERFAALASAPIVDANYINPILSVAPVSFMDAVNMTLMTAGLPQLGFYVVIVDGRGTPFRSRAFQQAAYPAFPDVQIDDHVATIRQLGARYPAIDLDRVGIWGSSNGGAGAARAVLQRPDFFKVAVASAGSHDYASLPPTGSKFFGVPRYSDDTPFRPEPGAVPANYRAFDNALLAGNLEGRLLLAYGDMDNIALASPTLRLAKALIDADKHFDLLYMPGRGHFFLNEPYFKRRLRGFFVEHLHGVPAPYNRNSEESRRKDSAPVKPVGK
ncbi:MAG: DPP IV N-terminal domain-containing protein [Pseudomonadota bacterium]